MVPPSPSLTLFLSLSLLSSLSLSPVIHKQEGAPRKLVGAAVPNQQRWHAKMKAQSEYVHVAPTFFARLVPPICMLSRRLPIKNFSIGAQEEVY